MRVTAVFLLVLSLAACAEAPMHEPPPADARAGQVRASACKYEDGARSYAAECGYLFAPERRDAPGARLIAIPYIRIHAQAASAAEPVFILNGGPGDTNLDAGGMTEWFVGERDIVLIGYRGVDGAVRLECPEVDAALTQTHEWFTEAGLAYWRAAYRRCAARFEDAGVDVTGYTMLEVVDDIEDVRDALGYSRINLLSRSYGTRLALIYGWRYPDLVARSAMVSVNPPGHFRFDPDLLDAQMRRYDELCSGDAACAVRGGVSGAIETAWRDMPDRWLVFPINRDAALLGSFMLLTRTDAAAGVIDAWQAGARGDYSGLALLSTVTPYLLQAGFVWGEAGSKALSADFVEPLDDAALADLRPGAHVLGAPGNVLGWSGAGGWPRRLIPEEYLRPQSSEIETLMLGGSLDVSTPPETARDDLLPVMPRARQVILPDFAHADDLLSGQPDATRTLLRTFFETGEIDAGGYTPRVVAVRPGWTSLPTIAKALVGGSAVALLLMAYLAFAVLRAVLRLRRPH